jgi:hypothetical protein
MTNLEDKTDEKSKILMSDEEKMLFSSEELSEWKLETDNWLKCGTR